MLLDDKAIIKQYLLIVENYTPDHWVDDDLLRYIFVYICTVYGRYFADTNFLSTSRVKNKIRQFVDIDSDVQNLFWRPSYDYKENATVNCIVKLAKLPRDTQHDLFNMLHEVFTLKGIAAGFSRKSASSTDWVRRSEWYDRYKHFENDAIKQLKVNNALKDSEHGLDLSF